mmetsp:Transcript_28986/g.88579  ORF Transcript_28986/g.88579 Transcript_28986/m.88579 type:complete len:104 (-) Transcript_28986:94-405(-)
MRSSPIQKHGMAVRTYSSSSRIVRSMKTKMSSTTYFGFLELSLRCISMSLLSEAWCHQKSFARRTDRQPRTPRKNIAAPLSSFEDLLLRPRQVPLQPQPPQLR